MFRSATIREGFIAGVLAASAVALWFFVADILAGAPLYTPLLLVTALLNVLGAETSSVFWPIAAYTVFHYAAFIGVGTLVTTLIAASNRDPGYFAGLFLLFAVLEAAFYGYALLLSKLDSVGTIAWYQIAAANLLASSVMGTYLWRKHPEAVRGLDSALRGTTP